MTAMTASPTPCTCIHPPAEHSPLAGCLGYTERGYCPCTAGPDAERASAPQATPRAATLAEGRRRRDEGAQAAGSSLPGHVEAEWRAKATEALSALAKGGREFTADDVSDAVGLPPRPNMLGGLFAGARAAGTIKAVGYAQATRAVSHARIQRTWTGA